MKQIFVLLAVVCLLFFILLPGDAEQSLPVSEIKTFVDTTETLTATDLKHPTVLAQFSNSRSLSTLHPTWVKVAIPTTAAAGNYCIDFALVTDFEVFYFSRTTDHQRDSVVRVHGGPYVTPSERAFATQHRVACFEINDTNHVIFVKVPRLTLKGRAVFNLKYTTYEQAESTETKMVMVYFIMAGSFLIIVVISVLMWMLLKDRIFLFFSIYVVFFYLSINKQLFSYILGDALPGIFLNLSFNQLFYILAPMAFQLFTWFYMKMDESSSKWRIPFFASIPLSLLCMVLAFTHPAHSTFVILFFNFGTMILVTIIAFIKYNKEKWRPAGYFLAAVLVPLIVSMVIVVHSLEILPINNIPVFGNFSMLTFCLILGIGVIQRYRNSEDLENLNNTKDKLLSVLAHDLRGPVGNLNAIMTLLSDRAMSPNEFHMISSKLKTDVSTAYDMLEGVLQWVNSQRNGIVVKPSTFNVEELINEVVAIGEGQATAKKISIIVEKSGDVHAYADRDHINIVIRNFLGNAIKFSRENSEINISFGIKNNKVSVMVQDHGTGLGEEDVKRILRKEKIGGARGTRGEKGTGLGLLLCQEFINYNHGTFHLSSEKGVGTTAGFTIPATP